MDKLTDNKNSPNHRLRLHKQRTGSFQNKLTKRTKCEKQFAYIFRRSISSEP